MVAELSSRDSQAHEGRRSCRQTPFASATRRFCRQLAPEPARLRCERHRTIRRVSPIGPRFVALGTPDTRRGLAVSLRPC